MTTKAKQTVTGNVKRAATNGSAIAILDERLYNLGKQNAESGILNAALECSQRVVDKVVEFKNDDERKKFALDRANAYLRGKVAGGDDSGSAKTYADIIANFMAERVAPVAKKLVKHVETLAATFKGKKGGYRGYAGQSIDQSAAKLARHYRKTADAVLTPDWVKQYAKEGATGTGNRSKKKGKAGKAAPKAVKPIVAAATMCDDALKMIVKGELSPAQVKAIRAFERAFGLDLATA